MIFGIPFNFLNEDMFLVLLCRVFIEMRFYLSKTMLKRLEWMLIMKYLHNMAD